MNKDPVDRAPARLAVAVATQPLAAHRWRGLRRVFASVPRVGPIALTLLLALVAALACLALHTPLPWMIGPLLATALATIVGQPTASATRLRNASQCVIGTALGLYFTPQVLALVARLWWAIGLGVVWALALGLSLAWVLERLHGPWLAQADRATTYFASPIGAASEMTLLGERYGARTDLVAAAHSLRVLLVALVIPFGLQWSGLHGLDASLPGARQVSVPGLLLLLGLSAAACALMQRLRLSNPWFIGALGVALVLTACGISLSAIPAWLSAAAQLVIGVSLGVRFTPGFVHAAPRWLGSVALATLVMIVLCAGFAWLMAWAIQATATAAIHPATLLLGTSPGGIAEMTITAKVLQMGVPVVTAFHVVRLAAVLLLAGPIYRAWYVNAR